jgi:hypothetical protein
MRPFRERQVQRPMPGFSPTAAIVAARVRCNVRNGRFTPSRKTSLVKAVSLVAAGGGFCISSARKDAGGKAEMMKSKEEGLRPREHRIRGGVAVGPVTVAKRLAARSRPPMATLMSERMGASVETAFGSGRPTFRLQAVPPSLEAGVCGPSKRAISRVRPGAPDHRREFLSPFGANAALPG